MAPKRGVKRARDGFDIATPARDIKVLRSYDKDLDENNRLLYYAGELAILIGHRVPTEDHWHELEALYRATDVKARSRRSCFFDRLPRARDADTEKRKRTCFWVRYCWLACLAADMDERNLLVEEPPARSDDSYKSWFWKTALRSSPLPCTDSPACMLIRVERRAWREKLRRVQWRDDVEARV